MMDEGNLFFVLLTVVAACMGLGGSLVITWMRSGFAGLHQANHLLAAVHFLGVAATLSVGLLAIHTLKKAARTDG
jgi:hypothetical protein